MIILGVVLLLLGIFVPVNLLVTLGIILIVIGIVLNLVPIGGTRRTWY